jgi:PAS domain S-box-containing protein
VASFSDDELEVGMVDVGLRSRRPSLRSLVTRLLLAATPVVLVVVLLVGWVAAPLLRTPGDLSRAEADLVEVQRYQKLLSLVDDQNLHWAEYQYLPSAQLGPIRSEMGATKAGIVTLREDWLNPPATAKAAFETYEKADRIAQTSLAGVDVGRSEVALGVLTGQVLPLTNQLTHDLEGVMLARSERLGETFAELAGNVKASFLGAALATRLRAVRSEIDQVIGVAGIEDLLIREASQYAQLIATSGEIDLAALGVAPLVDQKLAQLENVVDVMAQPGKLTTLAILARKHAEMTTLGAEVAALVASGSRTEAAAAFENRLDPLLLDELLPRVASQVARDNQQLQSDIAVADSRTRRLRSEIIASGVLLVLILLIPILLIGRSTVRPLRQIRRAADEVSSGNLAARTGVTGRSEVGELAMSFDAMAARVEESRASLMSTAVLKASSDLLLVVRDGTVSYASEASTSLLGRSPEAIIGQPVESLVHPEDYPRLRAWAVAGDLENDVVQARFADATGWVDTEMAVADLREDPEVRGLALSIRDVTERKRAEVVLAEARDAAVEGSRLKSNFLATMSHEIRTPMNGVIGLTGLLLTTQLDDRQTQYAQGVRSAGEALLAIINDILDFSKVEAGKLELEEIDFNLVQVVEEAAVLVADAAQSKGVELLAYCSPDLPLGLRGDPSRIRQVLLNLVSNAVKFTDHGEVVVRGQLEDRSEDGLVVRFEVSDTGAGIPDAVRHLLFDPFTQADSSTTREFGGTGLGLAISHRLVTAMGGTIGLDSEVGRGSTFWFTLPLRLAVEDTRAPKPAAGSLTGLRALIVDDNATNRLILAEQLGAWGIRTHAVDSGERALRALRDAAGIDEPYDLALLDFCMPRMDGLALAGHISRDPSLTATGLVLLTSAADVSRDEAVSAGVLESLTKPVRLSQLHAALQNVRGMVRENDPARNAAVPRVPGARGHVLVAEDHATNQMVAVGILESLGFTSEVANNGLEALQALARRSFTAVMMDCHMPVMDGYTATRQIRKDEGQDERHLPIIAMTAGAIQGDRERCLEAGMDDYVSKPVTPSSVDEVLTRWLGSSVDQVAVKP